MPKELQPEMDGKGLRVAVVVARFNEFVTRRLLEGAVETLGRHGVSDDDIVLSWVPGSFELPVVAKTLGQTGQYDAVICLGAVIRGETDHYNMVAGQAAAGISAVGRETGVPTTDDMEQAINRAGGKSGNLGSNAAAAAIETARLVQAIKTG